MSEFDEAILYMPEKMWQSLLDKEGQEIEEKGYIFAQEVRGKDLFAMLQVEESRGSRSQVSSDEDLLKIIYDFTSMHQDTHVISYHTHPVNQVSSGDFDSFRRVYDEKYRNHIVICPSKIVVLRMNRDSSYKNLVVHNLLKIKSFSTSQEREYMSLGKTLASDFHACLKHVKSH